MNTNIIDTLSPKDVCAVLKQLRALCERQGWLRYTTLSYLYTAMAQLEVVQRDLDKAAAKAAKASVTVEPVANASETLSSQKQLEQAKMQEASNELLKRLTQSKPL